MYDWIVKNGYVPVIVATKLDKINRSQVQKQLKLIKETLQVVEGTVLIPFPHRPGRAGMKSTRFWTVFWR